MDTASAHHSAATYRVATRRAVTAPKTFPPLEQVRPQIEQMLRQQALSNYQQNLVEKAKIQENF